MSIPVLTQVYDEMRRLAIAGSAVAGGDFRLKKLIPPLEKSGEKAPVFAKVAQAAQAVVDSNEKTAAQALLDLTSLVNAILYTQGETGITGELKPLETVDLGGRSTQAGARTLKPLLEALTSTGSGRMELIRDAHERGAFKDLRMVKPALRALDDPYPEIADFIAQSVLPMFGKAILPELRSKLDVKGRAGHLHRLRLMHELDHQAARDVVQSALNEGSKEMRVVAIECLGTTDADLVHLLEHARSKAKDVRAAALGALTSTSLKAPEALAAVRKAISGPDLELIIDPIKNSPLPEIHQFVLEQSRQQLDDLLKARDKKAQGPAVIRLQQLISCLDQRKDPEAEAFLLQCFENAKALAAIKSDPAGSDLNELVAYTLSRGTPKMQKTLASSHTDLAGGMLLPAVFAARATLSPTAFYDEFAPALKGMAGKSKNNAEYNRGVALLSVLTSDHNDYHIYNRSWMHCRRRLRASTTVSLPELDPRWLDAAVQAGNVELVCELARPGHPATVRFLTEQLGKAKKPHDDLAVLRTMVRIAHPGAADAIIDVLKKQAKDTGHYYYGYWYGRMIPDLPRSDLPKFEALLPTLPDKMVDQLMESVLALKNKPE